MAVVEENTDIRVADYPRCQSWYQTMSSRDSIKATARSGDQHIKSFTDLAQRLAGRF